MNTVATALGDLDVSNLGRTLSHEHLFMNIMLERRGDGLVHDERALIEELGVFRAQGGATIFDLTTAELTPGSTADSTADFAATEGQTRNPRNVEGIQRVSRAAGVHVVLGAGRYRDPFISANVVDVLGVDGIAEEIVRDLTLGIPGTSARAGLIGEIGSDKWFISPTEEKVFLASAKAHVATNAAVYTHAARWHVALDQIRLLVAHGTDPGKIAIGHVDTVPTPGYALTVAETGVFVGIDTINTARSHDVQFRINLVMELVKAGYLERILLSHDVCLSSQLAVNGGNGFGFVLGGFKRALMDAGLQEEEFEEIIGGNPARLLS